MISYGGHYCLTSTSPNNLLWSSNGAIFHILISLQREGSEIIHGFKSSQVKYYLWSDLSPRYLGDECVVVVVQAGRQAGRQDVSVIEEEVWVLQHHRLFSEMDAGVDLSSIYERCEM